MSERTVVVLCLRGAALACALSLCFVVARARAQTSVGDAAQATARADSRDLPPVAAFALSARGAAARTVGAGGFGGTLLSSRQSTDYTGGFRVWGSPIDRLTILCNGLRTFRGDFSPEVGLIVRLLGKPAGGWSLGASALYKNEGFAKVEGEVEGGLLLSFADNGYHLDVNAVGGGGEDEFDVEGKARFLRDLGRFLRLGLDAQVRGRVAGDKSLPGGRTWDALGGLQTLAAFGNFFAALTAGPATQGVTRGVGAVAMLMVGGSSL